MTSKIRAATVSIGSNTLLISLKVVVGVITGSVSIMAEAIHSSLDLIAALIAFFGIRASSKPADREHPFGHGKYENVSGATEAILIFVAAVWIIFEAIKRLLSGGEPDLLGWGIAVMAVSVIVNTFVSRFLFRQAKDHDSLALEADGQHLRTDVFTSLGVLVGLVAVQLTGLSILDPIIAIAVALVIVKAAWDILHKSFGGIVDTMLPEDEVQSIVNLMLEHNRELVGFHELKTRKAGSERFIDLHLVMPKDTSLERAHQMCDHLEADLKQKLPKLSVTIHVEPCEEGCANCLIRCPIRKT